MNTIKLGSNPSAIGLGSNPNAIPLGSNPNAIPLGSNPNAKPIPPAADGSSKLGGSSDANSRNPPSRETIYTVDHASFTVGGRSYDISSVSVGLAKKAIPACYVNIAPAHTSPNSVRINKFNVVSLAQAFEQLKKDATRLALSNLTIAVRPKGGVKGKVQALNLKNWLLMSCGLTNMTTTSAFALQCIIVHPAYRLQAIPMLSLCSASGIVVLPDDLEGVETVLDAAEVALDAVDEANLEADIENEVSDSYEDYVSTPLKGADEIQDEVDNASELTRKNISTYLEWDPGFTGGTMDIPCEGVVADDEDALKGMQRAMVQAWLPSSGQDRTAWSCLIDSVCPWFMTTVIPTYTETALKVVPENPWRSPDVTLPDTHVFSLNLPSFDPRPVCGATMTFTNSPSEGGAPSYSDSAAANSGTLPTTLSFIPASLNLLTGTLLHAGDPPFLGLAQSYASGLQTSPSYSDGAETDAQYDLEQSEPEPPVAGEDNETTSVWNAVRMLHLCSLFMLSYKQGVSASMSCALCICTPDGKTLFPGQVLSFAVGGKELFRGEIQNITHTIDCSASKAGTAIQLAYCTAGKAEADVLGDPPVMPYYDASK